MAEWTVILSGSDRTELAQRLADPGGLTLLIVPDIYDLPLGHTGLKAVRDVRGPMVVAAEYRPRATYWILAAKGVSGRRGDWEATKTEGRTVYPVALAGADADEAIREIWSIIGGDEGSGTVRDSYEPLAERWYPVIDYDRCANCLECVEFCMFGVYEFDAEGKVCVANPDNCKMGCPACASVCPETAIMFPRHTGRGFVAGDDEGRPVQVEAENARRNGVEEMSTYQQKRVEQEQVLPLTDEIDKALDDLESFEL